MIRRLTAIAAPVLVSLALLGPALALSPPPEAKGLAPHRAIYEVELGRATTASGITALKGRLVFEFKGSVCEGFTQNLRFVMTITNRDGGRTVSDLRSSTWENVDGADFKFDVANFENEQQNEATTGTAARGLGGDLRIALRKPKTAEIAAGADVLFPVQHTIKLLQAANRGDPALRAGLYDGSEKGEKVYLTNSAIGSRRAPASRDAIEAIANADRLVGLASWPVSIAYFDRDSARGEGTPLHEMGFELYENGVIRELSIDYGSIAIKGHLKAIEFLATPACAAP